MAFVEFDPTVNTVQDLVNAILATGANLTVTPSSINFEGAVVPISPSVGGTSPNGIGQSSFYDGTLPLGIDPGILLTSGDGSPPNQNTEIGYSIEQLGNSDPDLQVVANSAFSGAGEVLDANILEFEFVINDPSVNSVTFDLIFGSDEFPEFSDTSFVDVAGVFVNGNNVALFNNNLTQPLSVISNNLALGNFIDNGSSTLPIEYDGVSSKLTVFAPVQQGENTIKFGVADTGDQVLDSGLFIANLNTSSLDIGDPDGGGSGILLQIPGTDGNNLLVSDDQGADIDEFFDSGNGDDRIESGNGNDVVDPGTGNDVVDAGDGDDFVAPSAGNDRVRGNNGDDTLNGGSGKDTVSGGNGEDDLSGNGGNDRLNGGAGDDLIVGNSGNDILLGGAGDDTLQGGIGRDRLNGGSGNDVLTGGASIDRFVFNSNEAFQPQDFGIDEITDFSQAQGDIILLDRNSFTAINSTSGKGFSIPSEFDVVTNDADAATSDGVIVYNSNNGNLFYNPNGSAAGFGSGAQFATLTGSQLLEADDFYIRNDNDGDDNLNGGSGQDTASGGNGEEDLGGAGGNDQLLGGAEGELIVGKSGNDILLGGAGDDTLQGGIGRDRLNGGPGNDILTGGASIDRFVFNSNEAFQPEDFGIDEITDFSQTPGDIILLDRDSFTAINSASGTGFSIPSEFDVVNSDAAAATSDGVIVYNSNNGNLFYNPNGSATGFGSGAQFATLAGSPLLEADDFYIRN